MFSLSEVWAKRRQRWGLAAEHPYDVHRCGQLLALADGFERFALRLEREALIAAD